MDKVLADVSSLQDAPRPPAALHSDKLEHVLEKELSSVSPISKALVLSRPGKTVVKNKSARRSSRSGPGASAASLSLSGPTSPATSGVISHTKMCRDRLNNMFERLRHTLPPAPSGVEVKHKAQVLDYAIHVIKSMVERTSQLEIELAVSSNEAMMDWISKLVARANTFPEAAEEVMNLFSTRRKWKYAELWTVNKPPKHSVGQSEHPIFSFRRSVSNGTVASEGACLNKFSKESETFTCKAKEGVQGRVWSSMRPEWVTGLFDSNNFKRAELAKKYGLKVCLAVPITITGYIEAVMCFYDMKHRPYDTQCLELAMRLSWALGNVVGGKRANVSTSESSCI